MGKRALILEARVGIEPTHKGFADLSLTTWVPRPILVWSEGREGETNHPDVNYTVRTEPATMIRSALPSEDGLSEIRPESKVFSTPLTIFVGE
jgi:hypothetical protein